MVTPELLVLNRLLCRHILVYYKESQTDGASWHGICPSRDDRRPEKKMAVLGGGVTKVGNGTLAVPFLLAVEAA